MASLSNVDHSTPAHWLIWEMVACRKTSVRHGSSALWEAQYYKKKAIFRTHEALGGILGFWVSGSVAPHFLADHRVKKVSH
jgi:hypothetical protein